MTFVVQKPFKFCLSIKRIILKLGYKGRHTQGTGRRDRSQGLVPVTKSQRVNRPIFIKIPISGIEFCSPKSVPRIQTGLIVGTGPRNYLLGPACEQVRGTGPCDQLKVNQSLISICSDTAFQESSWQSMLCKFNRMCSFVSTSLENTRTSFCRSLIMKTCSNYFF